MIAHQFEPVLAGNGASLDLLRKEFPHLTFYTLPGCTIHYSKWSIGLFFKLLLSIPCIIKTTRKEQKIVDQLVENEEIDGIISDNRFGVYNALVPSVYISHQIEVRAGIWTFLTTLIHRKIIKKFDECWIPDRTTNGLSGRLGHPLKPLAQQRYIGILSRFKTQKSKIKYDVLVLLSGPEPQRSLLEKKLLKELKGQELRICLVRGTSKKSERSIISKKIHQFDLLLTDQLQSVIAASELVIARSGYSTIMDLAAMNKKAFFIPTPGQPEQEYLATHLDSMKIAPYCKQRDFNRSVLQIIEDYSGFCDGNSPSNLNFSNFSRVNVKVDPSPSVLSTESSS